MCISKMLEKKFENLLDTTKFNCKNPKIYQNISISAKKKKKKKTLKGFILSN